MKKLLCIILLPIFLTGCYSFNDRKVDAEFGILGQNIKWHSEVKGGVFNQKCKCPWCLEDEIKNTK